MCQRTAEGISDPQRSAKLTAIQTLRYKRWCLGSCEAEADVDNAIQTQCIWSCWPYIDTFEYTSMIISAIKICINMYNKKCMCSCIVCQENGQSCDRTHGESASCLTSDVSSGPPGRVAALSSSLKKICRGLPAGLPATRLNIQWSHLWVKHGWKQSTVAYSQDCQLEPRPYRNLEPLGPLQAQQDQPLQAQLVEPLQAQDSLLSCRC